MDRRMRFWRCRLATYGAFLAGLLTGGGIGAGVNVALVDVDLIDTKARGAKIGVLLACAVGMAVGSALVAAAQYCWNGKGGEA